MADFDFKAFRSETGALKWLVEAWVTDNDEKEKSPGLYIGIGVALGAGVGAALGAALGNVAIGVGIGPGIGVALGIAFWAATRTDS